ncbi:MAG: Rha family transcriptional regulator [Oscillibacter sp.]|nr:Rha family transcriptional regulator [Oscillibacter sp.]
MMELVFLDPPAMKSTPFTTSEVIAQFAGIQHHAVQQMCARYRDDLEAFGVFAFEMRKPPEGSKGGRPETVYHLNEGQATLILAYLKNTPQVRQFKVELVKQFYRMKQELTQRQVERARLLPARKNLTDVIRDCIPDSPHKAMWYKNYTNLAYRNAVGMAAADIRKERGASKGANAVDFLTAEEMVAVQKVSGQIAVLIEAGMTYKDIKAIIGRSPQGVRPGA